jgi:hypothetical protein
MISGYHKTAIKDCCVFIPKSGVAPGFEVIDLVSYQQSDSFSQLFFKQQSVKTHFGEYSFDIIEHCQFFVFLSLKNTG